MNSTLQIYFSQRYGLAILKLLSLLVTLSKTSKYILDNKDQVSYAQERSYKQGRRKNNVILEAVSTPNAQTLVSKAILQ